jgi:hypothetical protein
LPSRPPLPRNHRPRNRAYNDAVYESRHHPLLSRARFRRRVFRHFALVAALLVGSLTIGMIGYMYLERLPWRSAFLNSAMLLGGMGPVDAPQTDSGKLFAGLYALYAGLIFLVAAAVMAAPFLHRLLHKFHLETEK